MPDIITFETLTLPAKMYMSMLHQWLGIIVLIILICVVAFLLKFKNFSKALAKASYYTTQTLKATTCLIAIFLVFFFDFKTKQIGLVNLDGMLVSTFLVGALAVWEIMSMITAYIKGFADIDSD